jgi:hypothetical protein
MGDGWPELVSLLLAAALLDSFFPRASSASPPWRLRTLRLSFRENTRPVQLLYSSKSLMGKAQQLRNRSKMKSKFRILLTFTKAFFQGAGSAV